jgi:hypothetical protein
MFENRKPYGGTAVARNLVRQSIETPDGDRCVDIFQRADGSFGFEGYRRDPEDGRGWFPISQFGEQRFDSEAAARSASARIFPWVIAD